MATKSVLIDTSDWIDLLDKGKKSVSDILVDPNLSCHPFVIGELALGNPGNRYDLIADLHTIPQIKVSEEKEVLYLVQKEKLYGRGIGYVDCHLLASTVSVPNTLLWTLDKRLYKVAVMLGVAFAQQKANRVFSFYVWEGERL